MKYCHCILVCLLQGHMLVADFVLLLLLYLDGAVLTTGRFCHAMVLCMHCGQVGQFTEHHAMVLSIALLSMEAIVISFGC
jgi:hypothetical protein